MNWNNMNKLIYTILLAIAITGCSEPIHNWELKAADKFCKEQQSEIDYLNISEDSPTRVICMNGYTRLLLRERK